MSWAQKPRDGLSGPDIHERSCALAASATSTAGVVGCGSRELQGAALSGHQHGQVVALQAREVGRKM